MQERATPDPEHKEAPSEMSEVARQRLGQIAARCRCDKMDTPIFNALKLAAKSPPPDHVPQRHGSDMPPLPVLREEQTPTGSVMVVRIRDFELRQQVLNHDPWQIAAMAIDPDLVASAKRGVQYDPDTIDNFFSQVDRHLSA